MNKKLGFTLIELLVVISIIGLLTGVVVMNVNAIRERARDNERQSDLKQYAASLEYYANKNNSVYPLSEEPSDPADLCTELEIGGSCPTDDPPDRLYQYWTSADATEYLLWADLESGTDYWIVCSNGKLGKWPSVPSGNFACPL